MSDENAHPNEGGDTGPMGADSEDTIETLLYQLIAAYQADIEAGRPVTPAQLIAEHPELAEELRAHLRVSGLAHRMPRKFQAGSESGDPSERLRPVGQALEHLSGPGLSAAAPPSAELASDLVGAVRASLDSPQADRSATTVDAVASPTASGPSTVTITTAGRYHLLEEIGRGGMGTIYRARDDALGRELAVKLIRGTHADDPRRVRRFVEEAQIERSAPAPGHRAGLRPGPCSTTRRPFFAMKLVKGRTLAELLAARSRPGGGAAPVPGDLRAGLPDGGLRPRPGRDPPRPEAGQRDGRRLRRSPGDGLGPGQGPAARRPSAERVRGRDPVQPVHSPRSGAARERRDRRRAACWARRRTWPRSRPAARWSGSTSGPTSSAWVRSCARS